MSFQKLERLSGIEVGHVGLQPFVSIVGLSVTEHRSSNLLLCGCDSTADHIALDGLAIFHTECPQKRLYRGADEYLYEWVFERQVKRHPALAWQVFGEFNDPVIVRSQWMPLGDQNDVLPVIKRQQRREIAR